MQAIKDLIPEVLNHLKDPLAINRGQLVRDWGSLAGEKIAAHTKPTLSPRGDLCIWVDQATLAFELSQKYRMILLKRTQAMLGEENVKTIRFLVGQIR